MTTRATFPSLRAQNVAAVAVGVPRVCPGARDDIGIINTAIARVLGAATGAGPPNIFTTLARHRGVFRKWLRFAGALMPGGLLPRDDSELLILRVAHNCGCEYEWHHHERIAQTVGLSADDVARVRGGPQAEGWSPRHATLLAAADELHADRTISDELWRKLAGLLDERELIELCLLVGHYEMLAMTLNALRVQPDALPDRPPPRVAVAAANLIARRRGAEGSMP